MFRNVLIAAAFTAAMGCGAKTAPVALSMVAKEAPSGDVKIEPVSLMLNHEKDGWVSVDVSGSPAMLEQGAAVALASADVPTGKYMGAKMTYKVHSMPAPAPEPEPEPAAEEGAVEKKSMMRSEGGDEEAAPAAEEGAMEKKAMKRGPPEPVVTEETAEFGKEFCVDKKTENVTLRVMPGSDNTLALKVRAGEC
ncbi:MAG: hypothetical protein KTR31_33545 [Myxococcales bacterium]|nr:hypothetical protein [Myxococcales bacterium]